MDFFQNQEDAQRKTSLLVFYYALAVALIIAGIYAAIIIIFQEVISPNLEIERLNYWQPSLFFAVSGITLLIVSLGTFYKVKQLSAGGKSVAKLLGGTRVEPDAKDPKKLMLLNIVEEMAIASGIQVPQSYILENEPGINAFAAGFSQDDAVIGVTRGCLDQLSRDQLQGVIAHEFSHILYGDMRINIKLMGVLHGILIIALIGYIVLRSFIYSPRSRRSSGKGNNPLPAILFGLTLIIIGYIGVFFGNLIKSAVSRQREYLADASAVQFTRNPLGITGALKRIAGLEKASLVKNNHAQEASHLFFSSSLAGFMSNLFSTHPPIQERIKRLDPSFNPEIKATLDKFQKKEVPAFGFSAQTSRFNIKSCDIISSVGNISSKNIQHAAALLKNIPQALLDAAHILPQAEAIVYFLLLSKDILIKEKQIQLLEKTIPHKSLEALKNFLSQFQNLPVDYRLPLLDIAISALKKSTPDSYQKFKDNIQKLIAADGKVSLFEYTVKTMILRHLKPAFEKPSSPKINYSSLKKLNTECSLLLSYLAHYGIDDSGKKSQSFHQAAENIKSAGPLTFLTTSQCSLKKLDLALNRLDKTSFRIKKEIITACVACVIADGWITAKQAELIRVIADAVDCPIPLIVSQKLT